MKTHKSKKKEQDTKYAHNPKYCMILPAAGEDEDIVSGGQS